MKHPVGEFRSHWGQLLASKFKKKIPLRIFFFPSENVLKRMLNKSYGRLFLREGEGGGGGSADRYQGPL